MVVSYAKAMIMVAGYAKRRPRGLPGRRAQAGAARRSTLPFGMIDARKRIPSRLRIAGTPMDVCLSYFQPTG